MSDFFSNLIARSFTDAPVIRPRVPSLFESSADQFFDESAAEIIAVPAQVAPTNAEAYSVGENATTKPITNVSAANAESRMSAPDALTNQHATESPNGSPAIAVRKIEAETKAITVAEDLLDDDKKNTRKRDRGFDASPPHRGSDRSPTEQRPSSPPVIRVTIGRIEVRAIHTPAPMPKPAKPAPPRISLEDYLHKEGRGIG